jgi:hypothetical protein
MSRACTCSYYTTNDESTCPNCNLPLRFTLLPPQGATAEAVSVPMPKGDMPDSKKARQDLAELLDFVRNNWKIVSSLAGALVLGVSLMLGMGGEVGREKFDAIQVGMTPEQVSNILYDDVDKPSRFRQFDREAARRLAPDGTMQWSSGMVTINVQFLDGRVAWKKQTGLGSKR